MGLNHEMKSLFNQGHVVHKSQEDIFTLIHQGKLASVRDRIEKEEISPDLRNKEGKTLLEYAHIYRQDAIAQFLISKAASIEYKLNQAITNTDANNEGEATNTNDTHQEVENKVTGGVETPNICILL